MTESQWAIAGITTPVHSHLIFQCLKNHSTHEESLVIEPEKLVDWNLRSTLGSSTLQGESLRVLGLICGQHHE